MRNLTSLTESLKEKIKIKKKITLTSAKKVYFYLFIFYDFRKMRNLKMKIKKVS